MTATRALARRPAMLWLLRAGFSTIVLVVVFRLVPPSQVLAAAQRIPLGLWLAALAIFLAGHVAAAAKWWLLIGPGIRFTEALQAHLAGLGANLCLPGIAGGDVVRAGLALPTAQSPGEVVTGSIADRMLDLLGLLLVALVGGWWVARAMPSYRGVSTLLLVVALGGLFLLFPVLLAAARLVGRRAEGRTGRLLHKLAASIQALACKPRRLLLCFAISLVVQATFIGLNILMAQHLDVQAPVAAWFLAWSLAKIVAIAPISLGGLGVREAAMAQLLLPFGADPAEVIAIGLLWQTILYASGMLGLLAQVLWKPVAPLHPATRDPAP